MTDKTENWSREWNSSTKPSKQRKYRDNAPLHVKDKLVSANVAPAIREELGTRSISLRTGDRVRVMRGDEKGKEGIISDIDREDEKVYVNGIVVERTDGTEREIALRPSNLQVQALNIEDNVRLEKYDIEEAEIEELGVEEEEMEEALEEDEEGEMMQQMQTGESSLESEDIDTEEDEETEVEEEAEEETEEETEEVEDEETVEADYKDIVSGTISDAKDQLQEMENPDYEAALEAEQDNKNRTTFTDWLENQKE